MSTLARITRIAGTATLLAAAAPAFAQLVNGSFEEQVASAPFATLSAGSTALTGWTIEEGSVDHISTYWQASAGSQSVDLFGNARGIIAQTFATSVGQLYRVSFDYSVNPDGGTANRGVNAFASDGVATLGGGVFAYTNGPAVRFSPMNYQSATFEFLATSGTSTLRFGGFDTDTQNLQFGAVLDNVAVTAVPEPHEWLMMLCGLGLVGWVARGRRGAGMPSAAA